jgi:hypothetical protein
MARAVPMRGRVSYVDGYGWHAGRLIVWPALLFALWIRRRLRRKLRGEPFVWDPIFDDAYELDLVHRHLEPGRWRRLFRLEVLTWGGALLIHLGALALWWTRPEVWFR